MRCKRDIVNLAVDNKIRSSAGTSYVLTSDYQLSLSYCIFPLLLQANGSYMVVPELLPRSASRLCNKMGVNIYKQGKQKF